jgi:hypothetical protein
MCHKKPSVLRIPPKPLVLEGFRSEFAKQDGDHPILDELVCDADVTAGKLRCDEGERLRLRKLLERLDDRHPRLVAQRHRMHL